MEGGGKEQQLQPLKWSYGKLFVEKRTLLLFLWPLCHPLIQLSLERGLLWGMKSPVKESAWTLFVVRCGDGFS